MLSNQLHSVSVAMETPIRSVPSGFLRRITSRSAGDLVDLRLAFSGDSDGVLQNILINTFLLNIHFELIFLGNIKHMKYLTTKILNHL